MTSEQKFIETNATKYFLEFMPLLEQHKKAQAEMRKADRKIDTFRKKYSFLTDIIQIGANDVLLSNAIKLLLKNAGFSKVIHYKDKRQKVKREDIQAYHENDVFIIEVKGVKAQFPTHHDLFQILPYFGSNKKRHSPNNVYALSIISHDNRNYINNRSITFWDNQNNIDLINSDIGAISAIDLIILFKNLKTGTLTFEEFKNILKISGILTYDSKGGKTLKK